MKKLFTVICIVIFLLVLSACSDFISGKNEYYVFRLAEIHMNGYPTTEADMLFSDLVKEKTNGHVVIDVYSHGKLGDEPEVIDQVKYGNIDFARVSLSPLAQYSEKLNVLTLPFLYKDSEHMMNVLNSSIGQNMLDSVSEKDFIGLAWYNAGSRSFYFKNPVYTFDDLKGLNIRIQDNQLMYDFIKSIGAVPQTMPQGDVYNAIQSGVIDGAENNLPIYHSYNQEEIAPYYINDDHCRIPEILIASKTVFEGIPEDYQKIIIESAKETQNYQFEKWEEFEVLSAKAAKENGAVFTRFSEGELKKLQDACSPLYEKYASDYMNIINEIKQMAD